jgi:hypothetical protein
MDTEIMAQMLRNQAQKLLEDSPGPYSGWHESLARKMVDLRVAEILIEMAERLES